MKFVAKIEGMHCTSCEKIIAEALKDIPGVRRIRVDYSDSSLEVEHSHHSDVAKFAAALEAKGYSLKDEQDSSRAVEAKKEEHVPEEKEKEHVPEEKAGSSSRESSGSSGSDSDDGDDNDSTSREDGDSDDEGGSHERSGSKSKGHHYVSRHSGGDSSGGDSDDREVFGLKLPPVALALGSLAVLAGAYFILGGLDLAQLPQIDSNAGLLALFLLGIVTSLHCVAMCGGFVVSYSSHCAAKGENGFAPHALYAGGKLVSYTAIGALFGLLGSFVAITIEMRALAAIIAGVFLLLFGLNTLNVHPVLRRLMPRLPNFGESISRGNKSPLMVGLATGLFIACGPLQAMYVLAAGTGNPLSGGLALFAFGLGTLPLMFGFGAIASKLTAQMHVHIAKLSGVLVVFLALMMLNNGFALLGAGFSASSFAQVLGASEVSPQQLQEYSAQAPKVNAEGFQEVVMEVNAYGYTPDVLVVKKGIPVKWVINVTRLTGCNNEIIMREYGVDVKLKQGVQTVEFTPTREGTVQFSCWMGMIRGAFIVVGENAPDSEINKTVAASAQTIKVQKSGSCGGGGGGCGCGAR